MSNNIVSDLGLGLLAVLAGAVFMGLGEDGVAVVLGVLGVICVVVTLQRPSAE